MEFFKAYLIEFNFNIFCGAPDDISRRTGVPRRIGWEPLGYWLATRYEKRMATGCCTENSCLYESERDKGFELVLMTQQLAASF